jgi:hypothetical protein
MGMTASCSATFNRRTSQGRAELETDFVLFRGEFRVKLPFALITSVSVGAGRLTLKGPDGTLVLHLGPAAAKWAERIKSPKSRIEKLGVKPGHRVSILGHVDASLAEELARMGADVAAGKARKDSDVIFLALEGSRDISRIVRLLPLLQTDGALWTIRPKGNPDVSEASVMAAGKAAGLVDVKVVRFSETHTAEKFVRPKSRRQP